MRTIPRGVMIVLGIAGMVLCFGLLLTIRTFDLVMADASRPGIAVWVHTPHVSPGDRMAVELALFGGRRVAIDQLDISGEGISQTITGLGKSWGGVITSKSGDVGQDSLSVMVAIPKDAEIGKALRLTFSARGTVAESSGYAIFNDASIVRSIEVPVRVLSPSEKIAQRLFSALRGLGALLLSLMAFRFLYHPIAGFFQRADRDPSAKEAGQMLGPLLIGLLVSYGMAAIAFFAHPLRHATGLMGDAWTTAFVLAFLAVPPYAGIRLAGPPPEPPRPVAMRALESVLLASSEGYREGVVRNAPRLVSIGAIRGVLRKIEGGRVRERNRHFEVIRKGAQKGRVFLTLRGEEVGAGDIEISYEGIELLVEVAFALASVLGPLEITPDGVPLAIDGQKTQAETLHIWSKEVMERMRSMFSLL